MNNAQARLDKITGFGYYAQGSKDFCQEKENMVNPTDLKYSKEHTWVKQNGVEATIGITDYAQEQLGNILFVELKEVGDKITQSQPCGSVESDKATSDVVSPISGEVTAVNDEALNAPESLNANPYGKGWLLNIHVSDPAEINTLMAAEEYEASISSDS